jgi:peptidyl-prolyl cis-trans isomerase B (cyclophilin B)
MVKLHTNLGTITLELDAAKAPVTVDNFLAYVNSGFYANTIFHRVINGFMIQAAASSPDSSTSPARNDQNEADNGSRTRHTVAMARTSEPHRLPSQFFINVATIPLDFRTQRGQVRLLVFGRVVDGKDVVDQIERRDRTRGGHGDARHRRDHHERWFSTKGE